MCHYIVGRYMSCEHNQGPTLAFCERAHISKTLSSTASNQTSPNFGASSVDPSQDSSLNLETETPKSRQLQQPAPSAAPPHKYDTRSRRKQSPPSNGQQAPETNIATPCRPRISIPVAERNYIGLCPICIDLERKYRCSRGGAIDTRKQLDLGHAVASTINMEIKAAWYRLALAQSRVNARLHSLKRVQMIEMIQLGLMWYMDSCLEEVDEIEEEEDRFRLAYGESPDAEDKRKKRRFECLQSVTRAAYAAWTREREERDPPFDVGPSLINRSLYEGYTWDYEANETDNSQESIKIEAQSPRNLPVCDHGQIRGGAGNGKPNSDGKSKYSEFSWPWADKDARKDSSMTVTGTSLEKDIGEAVSTSQQKDKAAITESEKNEVKGSSSVGHEDATTNMVPNRPDSAYYWGPASKNYFSPGTDCVSKEFRQNRNIKKPVAGKVLEHLPQHTHQPDSETLGGETSAKTKASEDTEEQLADIPTTSKPTPPKSPKERVSSLMRRLSDKTNKTKSGSHELMAGATSSTVGEPSQQGEKDSTRQSPRSTKVPKSPKSPKSPSSPSLMRRLSDKINESKSSPTPPVPQNTARDGQQPKPSSSAPGPVSSMIRRLSDKIKRPKVTSFDPVAPTTTGVSADAPQLEKPETATAAFPSTASSKPASPKAPSPAGIQRTANTMAEGPPQLAKPDTSTATFPSSSPPGPASPVLPVPSPTPSPPEPASQSGESEISIHEGPVVQRWPTSARTSTIATASFCQSTQSTVPAGPASEGQAKSSAETASIASVGSSGGNQRSGLGILFKGP